MLQHVTGEPRVCVAQWHNGKLTLWDSTQYTFAVQAGLAKALKVPMNKVRVICEYMGGGFGDKSTAERYNVLTSLLSRKTSRPVKIEFSREENFLSTHHRYPTIWNLKYGVKRDGTLTAIYARVIADMGGICPLCWGRRINGDDKNRLSVPPHESRRLFRLHQ